MSASHSGGAPLDDEFAAFRQRLENLLADVEATGHNPWHITEEEHSLMASASEACGVELPLTAFRSSEGAAHFLREALRVALEKSPSRG
jgi:hypothetical protein